MTPEDLRHLFMTVFFGFCGLLITTSSVIYGISYVFSTVDNAAVTLSDD